MDIHNGVGGKGPDAEQEQLSHAVAGCNKQAGRGRNGESGGKENKELMFKELHKYFGKLLISLRPL